MRRAAQATGASVQRATFRSWDVLMSGKLSACAVGVATTAVPVSYRKKAASGPPPSRSPKPRFCAVIGSLRADWPAITAETHYEG